MFPFRNLSVFLLLAICSISVDAASNGRHVKPNLGIPHQDVGIQGASYYLYILLTIAVIICVVVIVFGCADICQRTSGFKDFDNEDSYTQEVVTNTPTQSGFTMYPPVENTPDSVSATPIVFEPLPDITAKLRQPSHVCNNTHLRPKVAQARDRAESEESLDEAIQRDTIQDKMRLQNLIMTIQEIQNRVDIDEDPANSRNQLPRSQLQYIKELGCGWFGKVLQGEGQRILPGHKKTKVVIQMLKEDADPHEQLTFLQEGTPYRDVDHQNVMRLIGQCVETSPFLTVLELCPFGDLKTYLRSHRVAQESFNEKGLLLKFACDMAAGLQALHQQNFIHGDFAIRNCMLASDLSVKVGDYGLGEELFKEDYYFDGNQDGIPIRWLAPEILVVQDDQVYVRRINRASNIWSYGVALWEVITFGALPYADLTNEHVLRLVVREQCVRPQKPDVTINHLERIYQLMQLCWAEPYNRPSLRELRIMLLHLLSQKDEQLTSGFDQKWNQLMPRRSPKVVNVRDLPQSNGSIPNPARNLEQSLSAQHNSEGRDHLSELNPAMLNAGEVVPEEDSSSNVREVVQVHKEPSTPVNDLSLEAEFSRASKGESSIGNTSSLMDELNSVSLLDELAAVSGSTTSEADTTDENLAKGPIGESTPVKINIEGEKKAPIPDIVPTSTLSPDVASPDFMTSTPKKDNTTNEESESYLSTNEGSTQQSSAMYHTAMSTQQSRESTMSNTSLDYDDRSILGQRKFADILQTVTMSFEEDFDPNSLSAASSLEPSIEEEVFSPSGKIGEYQPISLDASSASAMATGDVTVTDDDDRTATPTPEDSSETGQSSDTTPTKGEVSPDGIIPLLNDTDSKLPEDTIDNTSDTTHSISDTTPDTTAESMKAVDGKEGSPEIKVVTNGVNGTSETTANVEDA